MVDTKIKLSIVFSIPIIILVMVGYVNPLIPIITGVIIAIYMRWLWTRNEYRRAYQMHDKFSDVLVFGVGCFTPVLLIALVLVVMFASGFVLLIQILASLSCVFLTGYITVLVGTNSKSERESLFDSLKQIEIAPKSPGIIELENKRREAISTIDKVDFLLCQTCGVQNKNPTIETLEFRKSQYIQLTCTHCGAISITNDPDSNMKIPDSLLVLRGPSKQVEWVKPFDEERLDKVRKLYSGYVFRNIENWIQGVSMVRRGEEIPKHSPFRGSNLNPMFSVKGSFQYKENPSVTVIGPSRKTEYGATWLAKVRVKLQYTDYISQIAGKSALLNHLDWSVSSSWFDSMKLTKEELKELDFSDESTYNEYGEYTERIYPEYINGEYTVKFRGDLRPVGIDYILEDTYVNCILVFTEGYLPSKYIHRTHTLKPVPDFKEANEFLLRTLQDAVDVMKPNYIDSLILRGEILAKRYLLLHDGVCFKRNVERYRNLQQLFHSIIEGHENKTIQCDSGVIFKVKRDKLLFSNKPSKENFLFTMKRR